MTDVHRREPSANRASNMAGAAGLAPGPYIARSLLTRLRNVSVEDLIGDTAPSERAA